MQVQLHAGAAMGEVPRLQPLSTKMGHVLTVGYLSESLRKKLKREGFLGRKLDSMGLLARLDLTPRPAPVFDPVMMPKNEFFLKRAG